MLLGDRHRQRAGVVLHKDARDAVAARRMVDHPLLGDPAGRRLSVGLGFGFGLGFGLIHLDGSKTKEVFLKKRFLRVFPKLLLII